MKAKLGKEVSNARSWSWSDNKELVELYQGLVVTKTGIKKVVDCRCYMGRSNSASVVYASVWVSGKSYCSSGKGSAGGWGYHKVSAAIAEAFESANIKLSEAIGGCGDTMVREAIEAIIRDCSYTGKTYITHIG